ncbi:hypothetical protein [Staphylococcus kloosii]|uniref:hypothetical protein n=1 Tax=Staphylococcus kloosii TaxID=29384 RepID=UPI00189D90F5|nr:hypothetical protein [Staphylococcus kloosii]MBF7025956.1 hypothetical protein [Staphylococcus kloosii]
MDKKVNEIEALDTTMKKSAKGAIVKLKEITEELSKDITDNKKTSLLAEQKKLIKDLQKYIDRK